MLNKTKQLKKQKELDKMKDILNYSLSDSDIKSVLGLDTKIIEYKNLDQYKSLHDLCGDGEYVVILIESKPSSGHWTCISNKDKTFTLFDSYGCKISNELNFISKAMNKMLGQTKSELEKLVKRVDDDYEVIYNADRLQEESPHIATCGKWVCAWLSFFKMGYTLEEFLRMINDQVKETGLSPDILVCKLIPIYH